ncbi:2-hydroxyacid dehydrogenase [Dawidia soli]|uniref:2-hydroxyacid dehydrogenase n=1 Tax=Dawidia soli TaxID=2782352 RepID=A0AAP2D7B5_9BACT|nr:2-hydroxyacid dehydrogenase [Dawidia soli]MBT1686444.1 2-hydroxyacid dehydrogenase [Dawidia soli]
MKVAVYSFNNFEKRYLEEANKSKHVLQLIPVNLRKDTLGMCAGAEGISLFVNDDASAPVLEALKAAGVKFIALRSAGYNHVDLAAAKKLGLKVAHVPEYSPYAVAEHTIALILALNRKLIRAHNRIMDLNFSLDGLTGFDLYGKTVGIIGMGKIGRVVARIMKGFGCKLLAFDIATDKQLSETLDLEFTDLDSLCRRSDIITLHTPLVESTRYLIRKERIEKMKDGVMLINTSRGGLVNTRDVIDALKKGKIGYLGLDVYEEEKGLFFEDHSEDILQDDTIARLLTFKNVLITSHQAFLTHEALQKISETTIHNLDCWQNGIKSEFELA